MSNLRKAFVVLSLLVMIAVFVLPAFAQNSSTRTVTITEQQINDSYRVTNPRHRAITNTSVDVQEGQAVVSATVTLRRGSPTAVVATYTASVVNGRIDWTLVSMTANGQSAPQDLITAINNSLRKALVNTVKQYIGQGKYTVTGIILSADMVTVTYTRP